MDECINCGDTRLDSSEFPNIFFDYYRAREFSSESPGILAADVGDLFCKDILEKLKQVYFICWQCYSLRIESYLRKIDISERRGIIEEYQRSYGPSYGGSLHLPIFRSLGKVCLGCFCDVLILQEFKGIQRYRALR